MLNSVKKPILALAISGSIFAAACNQSAKKTTTMTDSTATTTKLPPASAFEKTINGKQTHLYILKNKNGVEAAVTNYGGRIVSLLVPNKDGKLTDVVLGFESVDGFIGSKEPYYGATIGRYGNRIAKGKFKINGKNIH
jgi:aldose 1-epimerase